MEHVYMVTAFNGFCALFAEARLVRDSIALTYSRVDGVRVEATPTGWRVLKKDGTILDEVQVTLTPVFDTAEHL